MLGEGVSLCGGERRASAGNGLCGRLRMHRAACGRASGLRGRGEVFGGEWVVRSAGVHRAACGRASGLRGRASALRGGAEVLGKGVSLCVGERRPSAGKVL